MRAPFELTLPFTRQIGSGGTCGATFALLARRYASGRSKPNAQMPRLAVRARCSASTYWTEYFR